MEWDLKKHKLCRVEREGILLYISSIFSFSRLRGSLVADAFIEKFPFLI
jgi:hypothetical protein